jgi:hypothetical protein
MNYEVNEVKSSNYNNRAKLILDTRNKIKLEFGKIFKKMS